MQKRRHTLGLKISCGPICTISHEWLWIFLLIVCIPRTIITTSPSYRTFFAVSSSLLGFGAHFNLSILSVPHTLLHTTLPSTMLYISWSQGLFSNYFIMCWSWYLFHYWTKTLFNLKLIPYCKFSAVPSTTFSHFSPHQHLLNFYCNKFVPKMDKTSCSLGPGLILPTWLSDFF